MAPNTDLAPDLQIKDLHTEECSYAPYNTDPDTTTPTPGTFNFNARKSTSNTWHTTTLTSLASARPILEAQINALSMSPKRIIVRNDEICADMPVVTVEDLERMLKEESVLGDCGGRKTETAVVIFDSDPMEDVVRHEVVVEGRHGVKQGKEKGKMGCCIVV